MFSQAASVFDLKPVTFGGFYYSDNLSRASALGWQISYNERFLSMIPTDEYDRLNWHELQHMKWKNDFKSVKESSEMWLFALHPKFAEIHSRMKKYYEQNITEGYKFGKMIKPLPQTYDDLETSTSNYTHPDEVLALLSGYKKYIEQCNQGDSHPPTVPYEFIEAFTTEDLQYLDIEYRIKLAEEVIATNPRALQVSEIEETPLSL